MCQVDVKWESGNLATYQKDILRPAHHARKVTFWLNILTDGEVLGALFDQRVLYSNIGIIRHKEAPCSSIELTFGALLVELPAFP